MSRIAKRPIAIPKDTEVTVAGDSFTVKGPKGTLTCSFRPQEIAMVVKDGAVHLTLVRETRMALALWGTYAAHLRNMLRGVNEPFGKKLIVEGIGYRSEVSGSNLKFSVGYSHPVLLSIPEGISIKVEKNVIDVLGIDKGLVGAFAAQIRSVRKPEPYKGKGIRYSDEIIIRKQGKRAGAAT